MIWSMILFALLFLPQADRPRRHSMLGTDRPSAPRAAATADDPAEAVGREILEIVELGGDPFF